MNQIMKTGFFGGGSDAGGAISGAATCIQLARQIFLRLIGMKQSIHLFMYRCVMVLSMIISFLCLTNVETSIVSISDICGMQETSSNQILNAEESVVLYFWGQKDKRGKLWG